MDQIKITVVGAKQDGISVIVCCYNSASRIEPTLKHLFSQKVNSKINWEIIVVDNNSSDNTSEKASLLYQEFGTDIPMTIVDEPQPGLMHARRKGIDSAQYEYLLFVDDDNWLGSHYVDLSYVFMNSNPQIGVLGGLGSPEFKSNKPPWFDNFSYCYAVGKQALNNTRSAEVSHVYGAGMTIRHSAWHKLAKVNFTSILTGRKGESLTSGEDNEICLAIRLARYKVHYLAQLSFKHELPSNRINWIYLRKLFLGFGEAKARLDIYSIAISNSPIPKDGRLPFWFNRVVYLLTELIKKDGWLLTQSLVFNLEGRGELLTAIAKWGQIKAIINMRKNYLDLYKSVYDLKQKLENVE